MTDRIPHHNLRCLLGTLLLALAAAGLGAQCAGPFDLACRTEVDVTLGADCSAVISAAQVLTGLPACLADSNFILLVEDGATPNGSVADGAGRFAYTVTGANHPDLNGFSCTGHVTLIDATPPTIDFGPSLVDRRCSLRDVADVNGLATDISRCWSVDGAAGTILSGSLDARLAQALNAGGGVPAVADACGGEVEVCVNDVFDFPAASACVDTFTLQRSFTARALDGGVFAPTFRRQTVRFIRPRINQLSGIDEVAFPRCAFPPVSLNPSPTAAHYPFFDALGGPIHLDEDFCELRLDYTDGSRLPGCNGGYSFVRTFRVMDLCANGADRAFTQIVRVGDFQGPVITPPVQDLDFDGVPDVGPLRFPTNTGQCSAILDLRAGVSTADACSSSLTMEAFVYPAGDLAVTPLGPYQIIGGFTTPLSDPVATGAHLIRYVARDPCGNTSVADVSIEITDGQPPVALCEPTFGVTLNGAGFATLPASALDQGSSDGCGSVSFFVARIDENDLPLETPAGQITLRCADLGTTPVLLRVSDENGNHNICRTTIEVTDLTAPTCTPPAPIALHCGLFDQQFPEDLPAAFAAEPDAFSPQLDAAFGPATGQDNCTETSIIQTITGELDECGTGQFVRSFTVTDPGGLTQDASCRQIITVTPHHAYTLRFPGDRNYECSDLPEPEDFVSTSSGCDLLTVNTFRDTITSSIPGSCYALRLTHEVINWCEYDGQSNALTVPRNADGDNNPGQPVFVHVTAGNPAVTSDDRAVIDQDETPGNGNELGQLSPGYGNSARRGRFVYEQLVGIFDATEPVILVEDPEPGLAFTDDCLGGVNLRFTATDDCGFTSTRVTIDEFAIDHNEDGAFDEADFFGEYDIPATRFEGNPETGLNVPVRNLPIGSHLARIETTDGCGNSSTAYVLMWVTDGRAPQPSCIGVTTVELFPDPVAGGINVVYVMDFIASPTLTCTETAVSYSLYTEDEAGSPGFLAQPGQNSLDLDCADLGEKILRLYAFAENTGLSGFCNAALVVTDSDDLCADQMGQIDGLILDPNGAPVRNVEVFNIGPGNATMTTAGDGIFTFDGLAEGVDYVVRPYLDSNPLNGLSTADLNMIGRRLEGIDDGLSPYQLIAADANNNGNITIHDQLMIREVILGLENGFDNNNSWRFVDADYVFPDPTDPWQEEFPETVAVDNLSGAVFADFVAIKIGDVSGSASPQNTFTGSHPETSARNSDATMTLQPGDSPGEWALYAPSTHQGATAGAGDRLTAMQAALRLPSGTKVLPGMLAPEEYHINQKGTLRLSHVARRNRINSTTPLLRFLVSGNALPELINSRTELQPEAYTSDYQTLSLTMNVITSPANDAEAIAASPNPFRETTVLTADWSVEEPILLTVYDAAGRVIVQRPERAVTGSNQWWISATQLEIRTGVFLIRIEGPKGGTQTIRVVRY